MEDPYLMLGVARDASAKQIRAAYRALAKKHHPDLNPGNAAAEETFKRVAAANELLSDPEKRGRYDRGEIEPDGTPTPPRQTYRQQAESDAGTRYTRQTAGPTDWNGSDFDELFGSMFSRSARPRQPQGPQPGEDAHYVLAADFLDAITGATKRLTLPGGRVLDVRVPPGATDGQTLRLRGQGGEGSFGGAQGDALIEVHFAPHSFYERHGDDLRMVVPISLKEAILGGPVEVPTPGGPVKMRIPPHSDSGTELRLRGRGVAKHGDHGPGDLYATLRVNVGPADPALDAFMAQWEPLAPASPRAAMMEPK